MGQLWGETTECPTTGSIIRDLARFVKTCLRVYV
jgi:hypothetical protein